VICCAMGMQKEKEEKGGAKAPSPAAQAHRRRYYGALRWRLHARHGRSPSGTMEVAVAIGADPALTFSAIVPAPPEIEEFIIAGFLRQKPVELVEV